MSSVGRLLQALRSRLHKGCGWLAYRLGWTRIARGQYERVLLHGGADFSAYIHLGRIAFDNGDYAGWRREFEHARRVDPVRFANLHFAVERFSPRLAGTSFHRPGDDNGVFDETGDRATWRALRPFAGASRADRLRPEPFLDASLEAMLPSADGPVDDPLDDNPADGNPAADGSGGPAEHDDCSSPAERRRLQALGPIAATELRRCDLEDLVRRLLA